MQPGKIRTQQAGRTRRTSVAAPEALEARQLLSASVPGMAVPNVTLSPAVSSGVYGYTPAQIRTAYGLNAVIGTGAGQTIAIVDAYNDAKITSDLAVFDAQFGLAAPPSFKVVSQTGGSTTGMATDAGWAGEIALDVEWAHAIAPSANILLVEAKDASFNNLLSSVNYARSAAGVSVVSMSWGGSEFRGQTGYDSDFTTPTGHTGVTFVAASGDEGSRWGVEWPASSPNVLSVGGTSLTVTGSTGTYSKESPWADSTGGYSSFEREPAYQQSVQRSGARTVPDVSYDANPTTGFAVYDSVSYEDTSGWSVFGGTSAGAPQWGAIVAICDQIRVTDKLGTLDGASQTLPDLYTPYTSNTTYAADYHDVTAQSYSWFTGRTTVVEVGYDLQTGLGTPKAPAIEQTLVPPTTTTTTTTTSTANAASASVARPLVARPSDVPQNLQAPPAPPTLSQNSGTPRATTTSAPAGVFNDTLIHRDATPAAGSASSHTLGELAAAQPVAALATATVAHWISEADGALASWLNAGTTASNLVDASTNLTAVAGSTGVVTSGAPTFAHAATTIVSALAAPAIGMPGNMIYRFANFDPVGTFSDAMADFARESATISPIVADAEHPTHRAWFITGAVLAVDAALVTRWYIDRVAARRKQKQGAESSPTSESPQAGPIPSGL